MSYTKEQTDKLYKDFNITSVCRADLIEHYGEEKAFSFTDGEMTELASKMADAYCDNGFWIDLEILADNILEERK